MAVAAFESDVRAVRAAADRLHVNRVIEFDGSGIAHAFPQRGKLWMAVLKAVDVCSNHRRTPVHFQVRVAFGATLVTRGVDIHAAAMLTMACRAGQRFSLINVMDRPVVTREAGRVGSLGGKCAGLLHMAAGAFLFEDGVSFRHASAGIHAVITGKAAPGDPHQCQQRQQQAQPEFGSLQRRRPLEIVEVDALREFLGCACACHVFLLETQRHYRMNGAE